MKGRRISLAVLSVLFAALVVTIGVIDAINGTLSNFGFYKTIGDYSDTIIDNDSLKNVFLNVNGIFGSFIDLKGYYNDIGIYIDDDYYIYSPAKETTTDYEVRQTLALKEYLDKKGINLIYVNEPTKYLDDHFFSETFGTISYSNRNTDKFLQRISEAGINVVDLREDIRNEGLDVKEMFYRTDHHWTVDTGFWAAKKIVACLNRYSGYDVDLSLYDKDRYIVRKWEKCWIGEQGTKAYNNNMPADDFTNIAPSFPTSFYFRERDEDGDFSSFYDDYMYNQPDTLFKKFGSWHYSYSLLDAVNKNVDKGKVLLICDSYAYVCEPFMALAVNRIDSIILRELDFDVHEYLEKDSDYDTVIVCYTQSMIGAHDDPESDNYKMFTFDKNLS